jgi:hypothetical protein
MMLSDGDSGRSFLAGTTRVAAAGNASRRSPSATFIASRSSTFRRCATTRERIAGVSTLLSSNTNAAAMCWRSSGVWLR